MMKKIIYIALIISKLYCADQSRGLRLDKYPIDILGQIAEFMPEDSEFVNNVSRLVELSPEKYYEIVSALILDKKEVHVLKEIRAIEKISPTNLGEYNILVSELGETSFQKYCEILKKVLESRTKAFYKFSYDYDDIDRIVKKCFSTTVSRKISSKRLKYKMTAALEKLLDENPIILLASYMKKSKISSLENVFHENIATLLFIKDSLSKGALSLAFKSTDEIIDIKNKLDKERKFLIWAKLISDEAREKLKIDMIVSVVTMFIVAIITSIITLNKYYFLGIILIGFGIIAIFCPNENGMLTLQSLVKNNKQFLDNNVYNDYKNKFYIEYRKRVPVSMKEIEETANLCIQYPNIKDKYVSSLLMGLTGVKRVEVRQLLENEITYTKALVK